MLLYIEKLFYEVIVLMELNKKWTRVIMTGYLLFLFILITVWSYKTPLINDDLFFAHNKIISDSIGDYFRSNGRFFGQMFTRLILSRGILFSSVCIGISFVVLVVLLLSLTRSISKDAIYLDRILLITITLFLFIPGFTSVFLWRAGAGNYLMVGVTDLLFLYLIYKVRADSKLLAVVTFLVGIVAGWGNENTSGGILIIVILIIIKGYYESKKIALKNIIGFFGLLMGYSILIVSPGSKKRQMANDYAYLQQNFLRRMFQGLERQLDFFAKDWWIIVFFSLVIAVVVVAFIFWRNQPHFIDGLIFIIGGVLSTLVMIIAPEGMDIGRPYFGPTLLMLIGMMLLIPLRIDNDGVRATYISTISILTLLTLFSTVLGYQNAQQFNNQLNARYNYIAQSKKKVVDVKPINYGKYNKYSLAPVFWEVRRSNNSATFPNNCYYHYFGKKVTLHSNK